MYTLQMFYASTMRKRLSIQRHDELEIETYINIYI